MIGIFNLSWTSSPSSKDNMMCGELAMTPSVDYAQAFNTLCLTLSTGSENFQKPLTKSFPIIMGQNILSPA